MGSQRRDPTGARLVTQTPPPGPAAAPPDEQRTLVEQRTVVEARTAVEAASNMEVAPGAALPAGLALQEFVIEGLVGEGGFGIVYLARDTRLDRKVALKEYMPTNLAQRGADRSVTVRSERYRDTFVLGLRSFVNEAKLLASFDHPSLVKVYRFWEENGTAYMVMPFYEGPTLRQQLAEFGKSPNEKLPDEAWLRTLLAPLIDALELIHNDHCWHRDIAPDNILLLAPQKTQAGAAPGLRPLLLDFGAARRVIGDVTHNLTVILKPGYAPLEQYAESESMRQGPWTDVYALCAVLYCAVTGRAPVPSVSRVISDEMVSAVQAGAGRYSQAFLAAIDAGLAVRPDARPQSMAALRERFELGRGRAAPQAEAPRSAVTSDGQRAPAGAPAGTSAAAVAAHQADAAASVTHRVPPASQPERQREGTSAPNPPNARNARSAAGAAGAPRWPLLLGGFVVLVIAAAAFGWWLQRSTAAQRAPLPAAQQPSQASPQLAQPQSPQSQSPQPGPPVAPAPAVTSADTSAPATAPGPTSTVPAAPVAAAVPALASPTPTSAAPATSAGTAAPTSAAPTAATRPPAPRPAVAAAPARTRPPPAEAAEPAPVATPRAAAQPAPAPSPAPAPAPAPPALDAKRFECEVLVRAGQKALANRSYDDAMQRADEAQGIYPDCPGAAELGRNARQAKDRARSSAVIQ